MALYRNVAGADALGIVQDYYFVRDDIYDGGGGGGGGGGGVSPQPATMTDQMTIAPLLPIRSIDPVVDMQSTTQVFYDPWYVPTTPPTIAPDPVVEPLPPDYVTVTPTGATIDPVSTMTMRPDISAILPRITDGLPTPNLTDRLDPDRIRRSLPTPPGDAVKQNIWPLLTLAAVMLVAVKGEDLLHNKRHVAFIGGVAALYYLMKRPLSAATD